MGLKLLLSEFKKRVIRYLQVSPSQLMLNAWGFLNTFELVMQAMGRRCRTKVFFHIFDIFRQPEPDCVGGLGPVGFRQNKDRSFFEPIMDSVKDFKYNFVYVVSVNVAAKKAVIEFDDQGEVSELLFPLSWCQVYYEKKMKDFLVGADKLSKQEAQCNTPKIN